MGGGVRSRLCICALTLVKVSRLAASGKGRPPEWTQRCVFDLAVRSERLGRGNDSSTGQGRRSLAGGGGREGRD